MSSRPQGIVVLGMPRSGTTLIRRLLDAHPRICCPGETFLLRASARFIEGESIASGIEYGVLGGLRALGIAEDSVLSALRRLCFEVLEQLAARDGKPRWACKTAVDSFYLKEIERIYGEHAQFVVVIRHGLDVVCSLLEFTQELQAYVRELHAYVARFPRPLEAFAHAWADVTTGLLAFAERDNAILVRYEDLVAAPEPELRRLFEFLGEAWDPAIIETAFRQGDVRGLGDWKGYATSAVHAESVGRGLRLPASTIAELAPVVGPLLERCGYPPLAAGRPRSADEAMRHYELAMMWKSLRQPVGPDPA
ncbi:MAG TPA: sulfotransferase [Geminicoccaceae bacterium]|nr:sulfotransferase [Geminicoccaceae bacterium]